MRDIETGLRQHAALAGDFRTPPPASGIHHAHATTSPPIVPSVGPRRGTTRIAIPAETPLVDESVDCELQRGRGSKIVSGLCSGTIHLALLITLGFCFLPMKRGSDREILVSLAGGKAPEQLDTFSFSAPIAASEDSLTPTDPLVPQADAVSVAVVEPSLFSIEEANATVGEFLGIGSGVSGGVMSRSAGGSTGEASDGSARQSGTGASGQSQFFGVNAYGNEFVYVLDMSTSMLKKSRYGRTRFQVAAAELARSVDSLKEDQKFFVILFCYQTRLMFDRNSATPKMVRATPSNKRLLRAWLSQVQMAPGTDPRLGVLTGLRMKPGAMFLLSDGEFNGREKKNRHLIPGNPKVELIVATHNPVGVPIHTIAFENKSKRLRQLAEATGGTHRFVSSK